MRNCQVSRQKAAYLRALASAVNNKLVTLDKFEKMETVEIRKQLLNVKGIGQWTTDIYLMFCLQKKDIFPLGDIAVINTVKELYPAKTKEEIISLSEKWKPLRSLASYYFWHYYLRKRNRPSVL
jgi:DNA-3-methyladenine glycosylase II